VLQLETGVDDRLIHVNFDLPVAMGDGDVVDQGAGIGTCQHERDLTDDAVGNPLDLLDQGVGEDRERRNVLVLHQGLRVLPLGRVVEVPVAVRALVTVLDDDVTEHVLRRGVTMRPHQRNPIAVLVLESTGLDRSAVRAAQAVLGGPPAEVRLARGQDTGRLGLGRCRPAVHQAVLRRRVTEDQSGICSHFDCSFRLLDLRRF
jgi:hypothetical protein